MLTSFYANICIICTAPAGTVSVKILSYKSKKQKTCIKSSPVFPFALILYTFSYKRSIRSLFSSSDNACSWKIRVRALH